MTNSPVSVPLDKAYRMVNHGPVILVSTVSEQGIPNACTVAWSCTFQKMSPQYLLVIGSRHKTWKNIMETGQMVINIPTVEYLDEAMYLGKESGNDGDKIARGKIELLPGTVVQAPLLAGCAAWMECKLVGILPTKDGGKGPLLVEAVAASCVEGYLTEDWHVDVLRHPTLHHLGGKNFTHPGPVLCAP